MTNDRGADAVAALREGLVTGRASYRDLRFLLNALLRTHRRSSDGGYASAPTLRPSVFSMLSELTLEHSERLRGTASISFDLSREGFACLQIPEAIARGAASSQTALGSGGASSLSSLAQSTKAWPPPDGYAVMIWFQLERVERKEERDQFYRSCFMAKKCVHCLRPLHDELALKCSHIGCRACIEALTSAGGECVVCNPPTFYLFRLRSSDGKSVSEAFVKGDKIYMRTSPGGRQTVQFHHTTIKPNAWHHAVFLHFKQRFQSTCASFYLDGILQDTVKCSYPSGVSMGQPLNGLIGVPAQVRRQSTARWSVGPFYLIDELISPSVINALYAAGPAYDKLFYGASGDGDVPVALDRLQLENIALLDAYLRDPVQELIESVDTERITRSSFLRSGLSLASAASTTAAAIVNDIKENGNVFNRIPTAAPSLSIPIPVDRVVLVFSPRNVIGVDLPIIPSSKLDGRPTAQLIGGASVSPMLSLVDTAFSFFGSGCRLAYLLMSESSTTSELEVSLRMLWILMTGHARNTVALTEERGYSVINFLLHEKAALLSLPCLEVLFKIVGIDLALLHGAYTPGRTETHRRLGAESAAATNIITNLQALQQFVLDHSLWNKTDRSIRKQLFLRLYSSLVVPEQNEGELQRNRTQLQSLTFVKQILYVLLEPDIDADLLQVIADLLLVCLTTFDDTATEDNFSEVANFLLSSCFSNTFRAETSSRRNFGRGNASWDDVEKQSLRIPGSRHLDPVSRLSLSPRGSSFRHWDGSLEREMSVLESDIHHEDGSKCKPADPSLARIQNVLLDVLLKAVQKHEIKESRDGLYGVATSVDIGTEENNRTRSGSAIAHVASVTTPSAPISRLQFPANTRLSGYRKALSPRWISYFLFPRRLYMPASSSLLLRPSTMLRALKLLCALLGHSQYETIWRKENYYRLLAQSLPCCPDDFAASFGASQTTPLEVPFDEIWYALLCMLLGEPVDGMPQKIKFDQYILAKDFQANMQQNKLLNPHILIVIVMLVRRYYNDPVAIERLPRSVNPRGWNVRHDFLARLLKKNAFDGNEVEGGESGMWHEATLDFIQQIYDTMPCIHELLLSSGSDKFGHELITELALLVCAAARSQVVIAHAPTKAQVLRTLLNEKKETNTYEYTRCFTMLAEEAAVNSEADDPFAHPVAMRAVRVLVSVLMDILLDGPNGSERIESFFDNAIAGGGGLCPPLHAGLHEHFKALVLMELLARIRDQFSDDNILTEHKLFGLNFRAFLKLSVKKMQSWQRAQHSDGCPPVFSCCGKYHFRDGQVRILDLVLFVLTETSVSIVGANVLSGSSPLTAGASSTLSGILSDQLAKGKKKRPLRKFLGRIAILRSAELEALTVELFATLNSVILHIFMCHRLIISDSELEATLCQLHTYREVVLGSRNNHNKDFFVCLCRFLLQLLMDPSAPELQEGAAHLWTDLMYFQRSFMTSLLTVEIRKPGVAAYSVNLMKNGFDVLLQTPKVGMFSHSAKQNTRHNDTGDDMPAFARLFKWLQLVGPPLRELENNLDRVFMKRAMQSTESIRDMWISRHKRRAHQMTKHRRRLDARLEWSRDVERSNTRILMEIQQKELRHQMKWRQGFIERQKSSLRQWQLIKCSFHQASSSDECGVDRLQTNSSMTKTTGVDPKPTGVLRLDFTEGPHRMRRRLSVQSPASLTTPGYTSVTEDSVKNLTDVWSSDEHLEPHKVEQPRPARNLHRRYSADDAAIFDSRIGSGATDRFFVTRHLERFATEKLRTREDAAPYVLHGESSTQYTRSNSIDKTPQLSHWLSSNESYTSDDVSYDGDNDSDLGVSSPAVPDVTGDGEDISRSGSGTLGFDDDTVDEKLRPLLVPGDEIVGIYDCLRVDGMDSCPGVFLLGNDYVYSIDNYQKVEQRTLPPLLGATYDIPSRQIRVMEIANGSTTRLERRLGLQNRIGATKDKASSPSSSKSVLTRSNLSLLSIPPRSEYTVHQCRHWAYDDILELHKRRYQLRHVALELFAHDGRNYLITFESREERESVFHALLSKCPNVRGAASGLDRAAVSGGDLYSQLRKLLRNNMTERWVQGSISNFEYLMHLNTLAGRSYNDLTQYPVFPWVLADYLSEELDLTDPKSYRDLSKPMGALFREEEFRTRYDSLMENSIVGNLVNGSSSGSAVDNGTATIIPEVVEDPLATKPFHYGTHYSSAATTLHYLMRLEPFTTHFRCLHDGKFDHADRLFASISGAWRSAAGVEGAQNGGTQDVKELIPEFFYLPAFLKNVNGCDFGVDQNGVQVGDVELPPWANGSPTEFVRLNREALESSIVSANLHHWIDLIFGYKQQGPAAVDACNVFYHLTYEGAVDLDAISDIATKRAIVTQIAEFGQTPSQLFKSPHPPRARSAASGASNPTGSGGAGSNSISSFSSSIGPFGGYSTRSGVGLLGQTYEGRADHEPGVSTTAMAPSPLTARSLASSFLEGGDLINRMQTIISGGDAVIDESQVVLNHGPMLQAECRRVVPVNPVVATHRSQVGSTTETGKLSTSPKSGQRRRVLSSGAYAASIHQIAMVSGSVEKRVAALGSNCLFLPPRNSEFLAWGFQDRSLKILSTGSSETGHGADSKVLAAFDIDFDINVAGIASDGRILVTGGMNMPVLRIWRLHAPRRPTVPSLSASATANRRRYYSSATPLNAKLGGGGGGMSGSSGARTLSVVSTISSPSHDGAITAVCVSRAFSIFVSGCSSGVAVLWDLNRRRSIRTLPPFSSINDTADDGDGGIAAIAINEVTGDVVVAAGARFGVYDVNGSLRVRLDYATLFHDPSLSRAPIVALTLERRDACEWRAEKRVVTGHADGVLCVWAYVSAGAGDSFGAGGDDDDEWAIELQARHASGPPDNSAALTSVFLSADERKLFTGSADGALSAWMARPASGPVDVL